MSYLVSAVHCYKTPFLTNNRTEITLFDFFEQYLRRLERPLAVQVWGRLLQLCKDLTTAFRDFKPPVYCALR